MLQNNAGDDLAVGADGSFSFATSLDDGANYGVTVKTQPTALQVCVAKQAFGTVAGAAVSSVTVNCSEAGADRFGFAANERSDNLTAYTVSPDGSLSGVTTYALAGTPQHVTAPPSGKKLYASVYLGPVAVLELQDSAPRSGRSMIDPSMQPGRSTLALYFANQILIGEKDHLRCVTRRGEYGSNGCHSGDWYLQSHPIGSKKVSAARSKGVCVHAMLCSGGKWSMAAKASMTMREQKVFSGLGGRNFRQAIRPRPKMAIQFHRFIGVLSA